MPSYSVPVLNLTAKWWLVGHTPSADPEDGDALCQLYFVSRGLLDITPGDPDAWVPPVYIRITKADLDLMTQPIVGMIFGINGPLSLEWYWIVRWWERTHAGFSNEYITLLCEQCTDAGATPDTAR
jgi:hypothetical protein